MRPADPADGERASAPKPHGVIGPNAIIRMQEAMARRLGEDMTADIFRAADIGFYLDHAPEKMVDEEHVALLHKALVDAVGPQQAGSISWLAGHLTGDYLLANRIPNLAQRVLALLPRRLAAAILVKAVAKHSWTFAGSGRFAYAFRQGSNSRWTGRPSAGIYGPESRPATISPGPSSGSLVRSSGLRFACRNAPAPPKVTLPAVSGCAGRHWRISPWRGRARSG